MHTIEVDVPGRFRAPRKDERTTFWIEPGPDLPQDCALVEGPLKYLGPREGIVSILAYGACRLSPADRLGKLRRCDDGDVKILQKLAEIGIERQRLRRAYDEFETEPESYGEQTRPSS